MSSNEVKLLNVKEFESLLQSSERVNYQLVDVREEHELQIAKYPGDDILNLPLSQLEQFSNGIKEGKLLNPSKPTICLCRSGGRSGRFANFLVGEARFTEVYNLVGGILAYSDEIDKSIAKY